MVDRIEKKVIENFGKEWTNFNQDINNKELQNVFEDYFNIFPNKFLNKKSVGADIGCGSGRWAKYILPKVKHMHLIDPSLKSINVAKNNLKDFNNLTFHNKDVSSIDEINEEFDFAYSLGVLHHIKDTEEGIANCFNKLKKGSPFLIYLYYNFENRNFIFKFIWTISNFLRVIISNLPFALKKIITNLLALIIYLPLKYIYKIIKFLSIDIKNFPLSYYHNKTLYMMRTDSLDRFGTIIEKRFSKKEIKSMLEKAGFIDIKFSDTEPYWTAICFKG